MLAARACARKARLRITCAIGRKHGHGVSLRVKTAALRGYIGGLRQPPRQAERRASVRSSTAS